jgi:hypothetical protein
MSVLPKEPNSEPRVRADRDRPGSAEQLAPRERGFFYADCDGAGVRARSKKGRPPLGGRPKFALTIRSDADDRNDPVIAVHDDDLIADDEVHVPAPLGIDLDEGWGNDHHADAGRHGCADAQGKINVVDPRYIAAGQHCLPNLRALFRRQVDTAARLACLPLLGLALLRRLPLLGLTLLRSLARLALAWLGLAGLGLAWLGLAGLGLALLRLTRLTLLTLRTLTAGLVPLLLALATLLRLTLFALLRSRFRLGLAGRLAALPALRAVLLHPFLGLTLLRGRLRLRALGRAAALFALHALS